MENRDEYCMYNHRNCKCRYGGTCPKCGRKCGSYLRGSASGQAKPAATPLSADITAADSVQPAVQHLAVQPAAKPQNQRTVKTVAKLPNQQQREPVVSIAAEPAILSDTQPVTDPPESILSIAAAEPISENESENKAVMQPVADPPLLQSDPPETILLIAAEPRCENSLPQTDAEPAIRCDSESETEIRIDDADGLNGRGLLYYRKWWEFRDIDISVNGELLSGTPAFNERNTLRVINDEYSYFIPFEKIDYIRTNDGLKSSFRRKPFNHSN